MRNNNKVRRIGLLTNVQVDVFFDEIDLVSYGNNRINFNNVVSDNSIFPDNKIVPISHIKYSGEKFEFGERILLL